MPLTDLTNKIYADAREEAENIKEDAAKQAAEIMRGAEKDKADQKTRATAETEKALEENTRRVASSARQKSKLAADRARREELDKVFDTALEELVAMSDKEYTAYIADLAAKLPSSSKDDVIRVPAARREATAAGLAKAGHVKAEIVEDDDLRGGFVFAGEDSVYDFSFANLIEENKREMEVEVANALFA